MVKITKKTVYYEGMPLRPLKMGKISIVLGRNLIKKGGKSWQRLFGKNLKKMTPSSKLDL
tara:strand:- start:304 stop:483 length:180 start_codon:yes stop_codon:yes gene_type:complete